MVLQKQSSLDFFLCGGGGEDTGYIKFVNKFMLLLLVKSSYVSRLISQRYTYTRKLILMTTMIKETTTLSANTAALWYSINVYFLLILIVYATMDAETVNNRFAR